MIKIYYILVILIFALVSSIKFIENQKFIEIILKPTVFFTELFYNNSHFYIENLGYINLEETYILGKDCLGTNFIGILFFSFSIYFFKDKEKKYLYTFMWLIISIIIGFIANLARVIISIRFASHEKFTQIHFVLGVVIYWTTLWIIYLLLKKNNWRNIWKKYLNLFGQH